MSKYFFYLTEDGQPVRVYAKKRPGPNTKPHGGVWPIRVFDGQEWVRCQGGEISLADLIRLKFIGSINTRRT